MIIAAAWLVGFLLGSIPFGQVFAKLKGVDLHKVGSGNIGATNAARALGKGIGVLVLLLDAGKAAGPLLLARWLLRDHPQLGWIECALALGAVMGHMWTPWLTFKGGKGVATGFGAFLVLAPLAAGCAAAAWVLLYALTRTSSVGSMLAVTALPVVLYLRHAPTSTLVLSLAIAPLIIWKHRDNIRRLLRGEESKV
jgi:acyl phosphate:glycerol-3-phosphate acyltransferase